MNRLPCSVGVPQSQSHMQPVHAASIAPGSVNIPGIIPSGISPPIHGMQIPVQHDRDHMIAAAGSSGLVGHNFHPMAPNPNSHHVPNVIPHGHPHQFHHPHSVLTLNRFQFVGQPELRIFEMNKRLQQRAEDCDSLWWDAFTADFFEDDATLTLSFITTDDGPKRYTIGRALIPRYFRSIFESGCCELYYNLRLTHEYLHHTSIFLDSESTTMTMNMLRGVHTTVFVEGHLTLEFSFDELMRIRTWTFTIRSHREMIWRQMLSVQNPALQEQIPKNITRYGMTPSTLNFFRLCVILEPMQELMSRQKAYSLSPRECLKTTLYQKWQRLHPQESARQPSKRRKRKGSATPGDGNSNSNAGRASKRKQSPLLLPQHHIAQPGDVMIVGEPTLMGGDFGDEDERLITRLENTQYDVNMGNLQTGPPSGSNMHHPLFPNEQQTPGSLLSPPPSSTGGNNGILNVGPPMQHFRGSFLPNNTQLVMGLNDPTMINSNSISPLQQQSPYPPTGVPVSLTPSQHISLPGGRVFPHPHQSMGTQPYGIPGRSLSGSNTPSSRDLYYTSAPSVSVDSVLPSGRANSTSSLMDVGNGVVGFTTCSSPNMLPSRSARFTPPSLPNGLQAPPPPHHHHQQPLHPHSSNFIMTPEMMNCVTSMPSVSMGSPPPPPLPVSSTSYTSETLDVGISLMHPPMTPSGVLPPSGNNNMKQTNSPIVFSFMGSNGGQMPNESTLASMMTGSGCDPVMPMQVVDDEM